MAASAKREMLIVHGLHFIFNIQNNISNMFLFLIMCCIPCAAEDIVLGDGLVLLSAVLYAVSNVCQEYTVKKLSRIEFLGMMGLFGTVISGIQL